MKLTKIVNDKIYIVRGETSTYDVSVIDKKTGFPFMLGSGINNPIVEFIVRPSVYNKVTEYVFKAYLIRNDHKFENPSKVETYTITSSSGSEEWDDDYVFEDADGNPQDEGCLFRKETFIGSDVWEYRYFDDTRESNKWVPYEFRISFMFPYEYTSQMEAKTYKYEVTLFGGSLKNNNPQDNISFQEEIPIVIDYKEPLLEATDFVVGGSLSE